jgi:hypothetical protein
VSDATAHRHRLPVNSAIRAGVRQDGGLGDYPRPLLQRQVQGMAEYPLPNPPPPGEGTAAGREWPSLEGTMPLPSERGGITPSWKGKNAPTSGGGWE